MIYGLDVSELQGDIDWPAVARAGFQFAYIKASEGHAYHDPRCAKNARAATDAGLYVGLYHFLTQADVGEQTRLFLSIAQDLPVTLPHAVDLEYPAPERWGNTGPLLIERCLAMCAALTESAGELAMVYTYPYFARSLGRVPRDVELAQYRLWIACYPATQHSPIDGDHPPEILPWSSWQCWQWTGGRGPRVPGVPTPVDQDVWCADLPISCAETA